MVLMQLTTLFPVALTPSIHFQPHVLNPTSGSGKSIVIGSDTLSVGLLGSVTGGAGAFVGVNGTLTYSMRSDSDFSDWTAYVNVVANKQ